MRRFDDDPACCRWVDCLVVNWLRGCCRVALGVTAVSRSRTEGLALGERCEVSARRLVAVPLRSRNVTGARVSRPLRVAAGLTLPPLRVMLLRLLRTVVAVLVFASLREPG